MPEWVDELFVVARQHTPLMTRFFANASRDLEQPRLANLMAGQLVRHPGSLEMVLATTVDYVARVRPPARR